MTLSFGASPPKILVVEDEFFIRLDAVLLIESLGYEVLESEDADEAILLLETNTDIRIVFTDIDMTGTMNGLQLAAYACDRWPPLKFIIVSGAQRPTPEDLPASACFLSKPYNPITVSEILRVMLGGVA